MPGIVNMSHNQCYNWIVINLPKGVTVMKVKNYTILPILGVFFSLISTSILAAQFYVGNANTGGVSVLVKCVKGAHISSPIYNLPVQNTRSNRRVEKTYSYATVDSSVLPGCKTATVIDPNNNINFCNGGAFSVSGIMGNSIILGTGGKPGLHQHFACHQIEGKPIGFLPIN